MLRLIFSAKVAFGMLIVAAELLIACGIGYSSALSIGSEKRPFW
jgi:hypothetical protein